MNISLTRLTRFLAVYRNRSLSRAAGELGMTHSALTKSLQLLEQELGAELFNRTTRSVVPTDSGNRLAQRAEELLALADQIQFAPKALQYAHRTEWHSKLPKLWGDAAPSHPAFPREPTLAAQRLVANKAYRIRKASCIC